jgi:hypothetical protein
MLSSGSLVMDDFLFGVNLDCPQSKLSAVGHGLQGNAE